MTNNVTPLPRKSRVRASVPWTDFEATLTQAVQATATNQTQVMETVGYSDSVVAAWRNADSAPLCAKYSLLGLLAALHVEAQRAPERPYSYSDLLDILGALAREPEPKRHLIAVTARLIADY